MDCTYTESSDSIKYLLVGKVRLLKRFILNRNLVNFSTSLIKCIRTKMQLLFLIDLLAGLGDLIPVKILVLYVPNQKDSQLGKAAFCHKGSIRLNMRITM